jgi:hypothetical protein
MNIFRSHTVMLSIIQYSEHNTSFWKVVVSIFRWKGGEYLFSWVCQKQLRLALLFQNTRWRMWKVKLSCYLHAGDEGYSSYSFLTSALDGGEWSASHAGCALHPGKGTPGTHWIGGWVSLRAGPDTEATGKVLCLCQRWNLSHLVVQSLVRHYTDWATPTP